MTYQLDRNESTTAPARGSAGRRSNRSGWTSDRSGRSAVVISAGVAVIYAALGLLTLRVAQMTGLAAPLWPSAGVAFAAALHWRWRALPGVFIGSSAANLVSLMLAGGLTANAWSISTTIGIGPALGAAAGAALVDRFVGPIRRLDTLREVLLTLALGGLLATTIAPTIGVAVQLWTGLLSTDQAAIGWLTWWVGDAIGVIVFAPLTLMALPSQARYWTGRRWKIAVPSLLIVGILLAAIVQNAARERDRIAAAAEQLGKEATSDLLRNVGLHQEVLEGLRGFIDASANVTAEEFAIYTSDALIRLSNLQALSWNPVVTEADLARFQASQRAQPGLANFTVTERGADGKPRPVSPRPEYIVVAYIEPIATNRSALGFDISSNPARAVAIETARDTGRPTATAPIDLVQESGTQKGMLALMPVYQGGTDPGSAPSRRAALRGFAVGVYRLKDLLAETFRGGTWDDVDIALTDVTDPANPISIADLPARHGGEQTGATPTTTTSRLDVYGRAWDLRVRSTTAALTDSRAGVTAILLLAALAVTFLLEAFLLVLSGMDSMARRLMSELGSAARYVTSILPRDVDAPVPVSARYVPSQELGGDSFDHRWIDDDHLIAYLVDVSGHGIAPAMVSVSVHNLLRSGTLDHATLRDPGRVLTELNRLFQMDQQDDNYFTIWYGVYQPSTHTLRYAGAGHPPALILTADGSEPVQLPSESIPIGVLEDTDFGTHSHRLHPDTALLIFSDGAFDLPLLDGRPWNLEAFVELCARTATSPGWTLDDLVGKLRERSSSDLFDDDCTLVRLSIS